MTPLLIAHLLQFLLVIFRIYFIDKLRLSTVIPLVFEPRTSFTVHLTLVAVFGAALTCDELFALITDLRVACKVFTDAAFEHIRNLAIDSNGVDHFGSLSRVSDHVVSEALEIRVDLKGVALGDFLYLILF